MTNTIFLSLTQIIFTTLCNFHFSHQDIKADAYVGNWLGHTTNGTFKVVLKEQKDYKLSVYEVDAVLGNCSYLSKDNTKNDLFSNLKRFSLFGIPSKSKNNILEMLFDDPINNKSVIINLTFVSSDKNKLRWQVKEELEGLITDSSPPRKKGVSVPTDLILEKVE